MEAHRGTPNMFRTHRYTYVQYMYKLGVWFAFIILYLQLAGDIYTGVKGGSES